MKFWRSILVLPIITFLAACSSAGQSSGSPKLLAQNVLDVLIRQAEEGSPDAMRELGLAYLTKNSAFSDQEAGAEWLARATEAGDSVAPFELALYRAQSYDILLGADDIRTLVVTAANRGHKKALCTVRFYDLNSSQAIAMNNSDAEYECGDWTPPDDFDLLGVKIIETDHSPLVNEDEDFSVPFEMP